MITQGALQPDERPGEQPDQPSGPVYELRVRGLLEEGWSSWFNGLDIVAEPPGNSVLTGPVADQPALHGLLAKVRDLGLPLISVRLVEDSAHRPDLGRVP